MDPAFKLARLQSFSRELFVIKPGDDDVVRQVKELTLALAFGFNVLKDLEWAKDQVAQMPLDPDPVTARNGQIAGMSGNYNRLMTGVLLELANAVQTRSLARAWRPWRRCELRMPKPVLNGWNRVLDLAKGRGELGRVRAYLGGVRNEVSFHFDGETLAAGYQRYFAGESDLEQSRALYASVGGTMKESRFYFADAAAQAAEHSHLTNSALPWEKIANIAPHFNNAIRHLVLGMLEEFARRRDA